ncbi:MAG TPA: crosslink repair DNA glycosylase YcaQ family protein [Candidatus Saccharimonadales bacterium]|nr:crosslink repair DNA glycosylase YcaQ family protein [Candidatus Saccharimonadales bacterium]
MSPRLVLTRQQILGFRRRVGALDERLPPGRDSLRQAAWAGLQDSMPRAALLSMHARVEGAHPTSWGDPSYVQIWGPRYSAYVVAARDLAVFSLGRFPDDAKGRRRAEHLAARLHAQLAGARAPYGEVGSALGVHPNSLRYAATTGTVVILWDGARQPTVWTVPPAGADPHEARLELARRHLHVFGPTTFEAFAGWAGIPLRAGAAAFDSSRSSGPRRGRRPRRGSCPAAMPTSCSRERSARCSSPTPTAAARSGLPVCGPARSSSTARSAGHGGGRTPRSRSRPGVAARAQRATPSRQKQPPYPSPASRDGSSSAGALTPPVRRATDGRAGRGILAR